jgi:hypothetical protein
MASGRSLASGAWLQVANALIFRSNLEETPVTHEKVTEKPRNDCLSQAYCTSDQSPLGLPSSSHFVPILFFMEKRMARFSTLAVALTVTAAGIVSIGAAQAAPPTTDGRYVVADAQPVVVANVAEHVIIRTPTAQQPAQPTPPKRKIWISMGFGF